MAMDMKQLEEKVKEIIVEELGVERDKLTNDASFMEDLGADSLDTVELVMAFEKEFDIDIPDEEAEKLRTVGAAMTGLGLVTPVGNDVASTWAALVDGQSGAGPITRFDSAQLPVHFACEVKGYDPLQYIDKKEARRYDLFSQFAMGAAVQAVRDACLEKSPL